VRRVEALEIEDHILDKIERRHGVGIDEVEEICTSSTVHVRRGREGLFKFFGQTEGGRYLLVVLAELGSGVWKVVTAREMTANERRLYRQRGK
jgi:uncharacterized protein